MGIKKVKITPKSPWQNPYAERVIGSIRRECLKHLIIFNEKHLLKILDEYVKYYNNCRTHLSLNKNSPIPREVEKPEQDKVTAMPKVGGLRHLYKRVA
jgi:putative transposase